MYALLDNNLPGGIHDKDEMDARTYLESKWNDLIKLSERIGKDLSVQQTQYLKTLKTEEEQDKGYKKISELLGLRGCIKAKDLMKNFCKKEKTNHF